MTVAMAVAHAEDGHRLWLRYEQNTTPARVAVRGQKSATLQRAADELRSQWTGNCPVELCVSPSAPQNDGFRLTATSACVRIESATAAGVLYGAYELLRRQAIDGGVGECSVESSPAYDLRVLNHWDNPNGTIERGYAGRSIFWNSSLSGRDFDIHINDYARANASIGINLTVLNNVNAKPEMLSLQKLKEAQRIADIVRPYGMRVMLSVNFASPRALGDLDTADPLDEEVEAWWRKKAAEIYRMVPDFGGFLVKANSEGEPGPMDYGRTHVDGANMLARALCAGRADAMKDKHVARAVAEGPSAHSADEPLVMWRAFVYSSTGGDRASQAYEEFMPFDGQFDEHVIVQIKNGPIDFQPREPLSPLFFGLKRTPMMPEFQITQEYLGHSIQTAFLAPMWREFFDGLPADGAPMKALAGVANIGDNVNWCGNDLAQANWYAFGRMAWQPDLAPMQLAKEFLAQTYTPKADFVVPMAQQLTKSRETVVDYMMPYGLHHIFAGGHHYGPEPWCAPKGWREDWLPRYYHKADSVGIGFDRTRSGSGNAALYGAPYAAMYESLQTCPEELLLWFHHVPWSHVMHNGLTLWDNLCYRYDRGVAGAQAMRDTWMQMRPYVDEARFELQAQKMDRQVKDAWWWRDACLLYFQQFSQRPLPPDSPAPRHQLDALLRYKLNIDNYSVADLDKLP